MLNKESKYYVSYLKESAENKDKYLAIEKKVIADNPNTRPEKELGEIRKEMMRKLGEIRKKYIAVDPDLFIEE